LAKAKFYIEMADAKNAPASGVRCIERLAVWNIKATINNDNALAQNRFVHAPRHKPSDVLE
jgi:hypothetical protein